jgi:GTP cyclohydrolase III
MRKFRISVVIFLVLFVLAACANIISNSYKTLSISKTFYDSAMKATADLQNQGLITAEKRAEINKIAKVYKDAHNVAVDALEVYAKTNSVSDKDKLVTALSSAASKWAGVAKLINTIKPGIVPASLPQ